MKPFKRLLIYCALLTLGVPWYWRWLPEQAATIRLGMPTWVVGAILASLAVSIVTAWLLHAPWPGEMDRAESGGDE